MRELQPHEVEELATDAQALVHNKALQYAFDKLMEGYVGRLKTTNIGDLTVPTLHASMRVLEDVKAEIQVIIDDAKLNRARHK